MTRKIYRKIAKKHGVTVEEVRRDMQAALDKAYENPKINLSTVPSKGGKPTLDEFLTYVKQRAEDETNK